MYDVIRKRKKRFATKKMCVNIKIASVKTVIRQG